LSQTYANVEVIVCDDESKDDSRAVIERCAQQDARVKVLFNRHHGEVTTTNDAYEICRGEIICLLDADDRFRSTKVEIIVRHFSEHPKSGLVVHPMTLINIAGQEIHTIPFTNQFEAGWIAERVIHRGGRWRYMPTSGLSLRRELAESLLPVPETAKTSDGFIYTLAPLLTPVSFVPDVLADYRLHDESLSMRGRGADQARRAIAFRVAFVETVNERLSALGREAQWLDIRRNLEFLEQSLASSLFVDVPRRGLLKEYTDFVRALVTDDLYRNPQKEARMVIYGIALLLPTKMRSMWLTMALEPTRPKRHIRAFISRLMRQQRGPKWRERVNG
ncbi:MAG: glycosyltransferase, partial [Acidobacteriota bacterium]|nr:glycosyltransferase [Acidobacteriota bacterium]